MFVSGVMNYPGSAIGFVKAVVAFDDITIASLVLGLQVMCMGVFDFVFIRVFGISLKINKYMFKGSKGSHPDFWDPS